MSIPHSWVFFWYTYKKYFGILSKFSENDPRTKLIEKNNYKEIIFVSTGIMVSVFANGQRDLGSIPGRFIPKTQKKWYLMSPWFTLSIIRCGSRVKWSDPGKGVLAIEKRAFESASTKVANFTYLLWERSHWDYRKLIHTTEQE